MPCSAQKQHKHTMADMKCLRGSLRTKSIRSMCHGDGATRTMSTSRPRPTQGQSHANTHTYTHRGMTTMMMGRNGNTSMGMGMSMGRVMSVRARAASAPSSSTSSSSAEEDGGASKLDGISAFDRVSILAEALPYLQRFAQKTIVVKYGGAAMKDPALKARVVSDVVLLSCVGIRIVMIHGGGPEINKWLDKVGIQPKFHNGLRVTDDETMEIVEAVLAGKVNKSIVTLINQAGGKAVGLCGKDANIISARQTSDKELGYVGEVSGVDPKLIGTIVETGNIPVVASVAADTNGQSLNVNADIAAGEIAASLGAEKLILMTDVPGVMKDKDDVSTLYRELNISSTRELIEQGVIAGGMIPKVECCVRSIAQGVKASHIIDGRQPHSLLQEILTDEGVGTMITG